MRWLCAACRLSLVLDPNHRGLRRGLRAALHNTAAVFNEPNFVRAFGPAVRRFAVDDNRRVRIGLRQFNLGKRRLRKNMATKKHTAANCLRAIANLRRSQSCARRTCRTHLAVKLRITQTFLCLCANARELMSEGWRCKHRADCAIHTSAVVETPDETEPIRKDENPCEMRLYPSKSGADYRSERGKWSREVEGFRGALKSFLQNDL